MVHSAANHLSEMNTDPSTTDETESTEPGSLGGRLFNIFAAPGEVFEELRSSQPSHGNWLVPILMSIAMGVVFSLVVFSQPDIVASVFGPQEAALNARVEAGKITQAEADQALEGMRKMQPLMKYIGIGGAILGNLFFFVLVSLLMWVLTAKILGGGIPMSKAFELTGLASMISVLASVITMLIVLLKANINAGPNAALFITSFDQSSYLHQFLAAFSFTTIWYNLVLAIGVSRLSGRSFVAAASWIFGVWFVFRFGMAAATAWWAHFQTTM